MFTSVFDCWYFYDPQLVYSLRNEFMDTTIGRRQPPVIDVTLYTDMGGRVKDPTVSPV